MTTDWYFQELRTSPLEDQRLTQRFVEILRSLSQHPNVSIPAATSGHAEIIATYAFLSCEGIRIYTCKVIL